MQGRLARIEPVEIADQALETAPGVSLFRRTTSLSANPTTQGVSLRGIALLAWLTSR